MQPNVHCSIIYNSQGMEAAYVPTNRRLDKEHVVHMVPCGANWELIFIAIRGVPSLFFTLFYYLPKCFVVIKLYNQTALSNIER